MYQKLKNNNVLNFASGKRHSGRANTRYISRQKQICQYACILLYQVHARTLACAGKRETANKIKQCSI